MLYNRTYLGYTFYSRPERLFIWYFKTAVLFVLILLGASANATDYYFSVSGNDANSGTDPSFPWRTLTKLNSFKNLKPGDNVLFKRGDTFYGSITVSNSGNSGNPITFSAYGTGEKPVITGFSRVSEWTSLGGNIWESSVPVSSLTVVNMVVINGVNTPMGRFPNKGYLTFQSHAGNTSITSAAISSSYANWTGAEIVIKKERWALEKGTVTGQSGNVVYYKDPAIYTPKDGFGFFIQNDVRTLDTLNEWYFNSRTRKLRIFNRNRPSEILVATIDTLVDCSSVSNIVIEGISFRGSNSAALLLANTSHITIKNCDIMYAATEGVYGENAAAVTLENNTIRNTNGNGIKLTVNCPDAIIKNNHIRNSGLVAGMSKMFDFGAIQTDADNSLIFNNNIDSSGYNGIIFLGNNGKVKNNFINHSCFVQDDGGGIYTGGEKKGREISGNIVLNTVGTTEGTNSTDLLAFGIYIDEKGEFIDISGNTIAGCRGAGLYIHDAFDLVIKNNTVYNNGKAKNWIRGAMMLYFDGSRAIRNLQITHNIFFARDPAQLCLYFCSIANDIPQFGLADNNFYARPIDEGYTLATTAADDQGRSVSRDLPGWKAYSGQDSHSEKAATEVSDVTDLRFEYNAGSSDKTISLDAEYVDVAGVAYSKGSITLAPFSSVVLIKSGEVTTYPPKANAGSSQTISLPGDSVHLSGSGTSPAGRISTYNWTNISGPAQVNISAANSAGTSVHGLVQGVYSFELSVTDDLGASGKDTMKVTVNPAPNRAPVCTAGADKNITLPLNAVTLTGTATDGDGKVVTYVWTKIAGPSGYRIVNPALAVTDVTELGQGVYQFELKVTDDKGGSAKDTIRVIVNAPNAPPVADAGNDMAITLPTNSIQLSGSAADADGSVKNYLWTKISGPAGGNIINSTSSKASVTGLVPGVYEFELKVTDNKGAAGKSTMQVIVHAANIPPSSNAGKAQTIQLPVSSVYLSGSGSDLEGTFLSFLWTKITGPVSGKIETADAATTLVSGLSTGFYQFELQVTDKDGGIGRDTVEVKVMAANVPPVSNAGEDKKITLPLKAITLYGSGNDPDGTVAGYVWTKILGPAGGSISGVHSPDLTLTEPVQGIYLFELMVRDDHGVTGRDTAQLTVYPENKAPVADAGPDLSVTLPVNMVTLQGNGGDADGSVLSYFWKKISGPLGAELAHTRSAITTVSHLVEGVYQFKLSVSDHGGGIGTATVQITVHTANISPVAIAGTDTHVALPASSTLLKGSGSDADGIVAGYLWSILSAPSACNIVNPASPITDVSGMGQGVYVFELKVTDNFGGTGRDTVRVTVDPANKAPLVVAGTDETITLPVDSVLLSGSGSDADGSVTRYLWTKVSGPLPGTIGDPAWATTTVSGLTTGIYLFELRATDNRGATGSARIQVKVAASNSLPLADAGPDIVVSLPVNEVTLHGHGSDEDGTVSAYTWRQISGSPECAIDNPTNADIHIKNFIDGNYGFELTVSDNGGGIDKDTMQLIVALNRLATQLNLLEIYPVPVSDVTTLKIQTAKQHSKLLIIIADARGKIIYRQNKKVDNGTLTAKIDMMNFAKGIYTLTVYIDNKDKETRKIVKL